ncbi:MAG: hypothetical protein OEZ01_11200 [Candidatus Heimdallarchaeota archaeon]|nr:hypothetical protein [Candidatus Heimdallarchaeota archaeon]MDH5646568.1 hypothetical protein [Candidatus Heimdallarchaeota archaeon]
MAHDVDPLQITAATLIALLSITIVGILYKRRTKTGIQALDILIYLFTAMSFLGVFELISVFLHDSIPFFLPDDEIIMLVIHPVRFTNLVIIVILFVFGESILSHKVNIYRLSALIVLISGMVFVGIVSLSLGEPIKTNDIIPFANSTKFDEFIFDLLQLFVIGYISYVFFLQFTFHDSKQFRTYIGLLLTASFLYSIAMIIEVIEHFTSKVKVDAFISAFPTIALIAYVYIRYPNMIYLVPTDIKFLQLVDVKSGLPLYVAEFEEDVDTLDFLVGPGLSSIRTLLVELLEEKDHIFRLKSFSYSNGFLVFEEGSGLVAILQTDRLSRILLTSLKFFIHEFEKIFADQIANFNGEIVAVNGNSPDDVLRKCIPIVVARPILSSLK